MGNRYGAANNAASNTTNNPAPTLPQGIGLRLARAACISLTGCGTSCGCAARSALALAASAARCSAPAQVLACASASFLPSSSEGMCAFATALGASLVTSSGSFSAIATGDDGCCCCCCCSCSSSGTVDTGGAAGSGVAKLNGSSLIASSGSPACGKVASATAAHASTTS